mgnify:CR=1 FL=1
MLKTFCLSEEEKAGPPLIGGQKDTEVKKFQNLDLVVRVWFHQIKIRKIHKRSKLKEKSWKRGSEY